MKISVRDTLKLLAALVCVGALGFSVLLALILRDFSVMEGEPEPFQAASLLLGISGLVVPALIITIATIASVLPDKFIDVRKRLGSVTILLAVLMPLFVLASMMFPTGPHPHAIRFDLPEQPATDRVLGLMLLVGVYVMFASFFIVWGRYLRRDALVTTE